MVDVFKYGRQYIISNKELEGFESWNTLKSLDDKVKIYCESNIDCVVAKGISCELFIIGYILNPRHPEQTNQDIVNELSNSDSFETLTKESFQYGGRYFIVYKDDDNLYVIPDAIAYREIYYYFAGEDFYISSQVKLINKATNLDKRQDPDLLDFLNHNSFKGPNVQSFIGDKTHYKHVNHLLPNHYLNISNKQVVRFFPLIEIPKLNIDEAVEKCAILLAGLMKAISLRNNISIAFTSGWDSRLVVSTTKSFKDKCTYFINRYPYMNSKTPDILIPKKLSKKLNIDFKILELEEEVNDEFISIYKESYDFAPESQFLLQAHYSMSQRKIHQMNILTIGSEIGRGSKMARSFYKNKVQLSGEKLSKMAYYGNNPYSIKECNEWLLGLQDYNLESVHLIDLFFWEQRVGIWGARSATLADIYRETFTPFNCRELLIIMLGIDSKYRQHNSVLYTKLIKKLWPELMSEPVNPPANFKDKLKKTLMKLGVFNFLKSLKYK